MKHIETKQIIEIRMLIRSVLLFCLFSFSLSPTLAQTIVKGDCTPPITNDADRAEARGAKFRLPIPNKDWNPERIYHQLVILISFSDTDFSLEHPLETYDSIFNKFGYNQRDGYGCVADYYRDQSAGMLNLQFDVYGPYKVSTKAQPYTAPDENTRNYGREVMVEATQMFLNEHPDLSLADYDWNGDGYVNQVVYVSAGYSGNQNSSKCYGYIWPNTSSFSSITANDGRHISSYTISGERWSNNTSCGIGTICHEFAHSLGLPDIYPTNGWTYSAVDEWDLMDGGNFTNYGWCPPNFSPLEKMLLGWLTPIELKTDTTIVGLKPVAEGGAVYQVKHTNDEYLLLENRQWQGWDYGLPGKGLVVYHVNYNATRWNYNSVNNSNSQLYYSLMAADNMNYDEWEQLVLSWGVTSMSGTYRNSPRLNRYMLSSAAYPWTTDSTTTIADSLTDNSLPATIMYTTNTAGSRMLSKPINNIKVTDGLVAFDFMGGSHDPVGIIENTEKNLIHRSKVYDLKGRCIVGKTGHGLYVIKNEDGTIKKVFK